MQRKTGLIPVVTGMVFLALGACDNPALSKVDQYVMCDVRIFPAPAYGHLRLSSGQVLTGGNVTIYANPEPGYILTDIILQRESANAKPSKVLVSEPKRLEQINSNTAVTAVFQPKDPAKQTISVEPSITNGVIFPNRLSEQAGTNIQINIIPEPGYDIADGSLKVYGVNTGESVPVSTSLPYTFTLPAEDVMIESRFERLNSEDLKSRAWNYLSVGQYDTAAALYESAYKLNPGDSELILYSSLGLLGNILIDPNVRSLFARGSLWFEPVPDTLYDWLCDWTGNDTDRWYQKYAATIYTPKDATLPKFYTRFDGFVTPFGDSPFNQQPGVGHLVAGDGRPTREKFNALIFWALVSSYRSGLNPFIERVNRYVFGEKFGAALARAETLGDEARVPLNPRLKERFHLEDYYGGEDTFIGKPELDYIFGNLLAVKAAFEYLSVYDWTIDMRNWLVDALDWNCGLEQILEKMFVLQKSDIVHKNLWSDLATVAKMLPLKNNFLQVRDTRAMTKARMNITKAVAMASSSMEYWYGYSGSTTPFTEMAKNKHQWARQAWSQSKDALSGGNNGIFYFPWHLPDSVPGSYWPDGSNDEYDGDTASIIYGNKIYGVKLSKFFTPGVFTLTNLFTTESGGRAPSLFKIEWYEDDEFNPVYLGDYNYKLVTGPITGRGGEQNVAGTGYDASYGIYTFEVNTKNLKEIFPKGFGDIGNANGGKALFSKVFPHIPLWPWAETYFTGISEVAGRLYEFYHKSTVD